MGRTISWKGLKSLMDIQDSLRDRTEKSHVFVRKGHSHGQDSLMDKVDSYVHRQDSSVCSVVSSLCSLRGVFRVVYGD